MLHLCMMLVHVIVHSRSRYHPDPMVQAQPARTALDCSVVLLGWVWIGFQGSLGCTDWADTWVEDWIEFEEAYGWRNDQQAVEKLLG